MKYRNGSNDGWLINLKCGVVKEVLDNGETYYWVIDDEQGIEEVFSSLKEAKRFMR